MYVEANVCDTWEDSVVPNKRDAGGSHGCPDTT